MDIRCFYCGHCIALHQVDQSHEGPVRCLVCKNVMTVRIEGGYLRGMAPDTVVPVIAAASNPAAAPRTRRRSTRTHPGRL